MDSNAWVDGDVGSWFLRSLAYDTKQPLLAWATSGQSLRHGDIVCLRGDTGTGKSLVVAQALAEFLMPPSAGGFGTECLLLLGNDNISPHLLREQIAAKLAQNPHNATARGKLDEVVSESFSNFHVVSVGSVDQLQQFVKMLPKLLNGYLRFCRVVFVDDLDLGMASVPSFAPQMTQLTEVVHSFLQAAARHGLLTIYGLNRRLAVRVPQQQQPIIHKSFPPIHTSIEMEKKTHLQQPDSAAFPGSKQTRNTPSGAATGSLFSYVESASCRLVSWRPPRRFVLHLFREPRQQQRSYSWIPSRIVCISETEGNCTFAINRDGQFTRLNV